MCTINSYSSNLWSGLYFISQSYNIQIWQTYAPVVHSPKYRSVIRKKEKIFMDCDSFYYNRNFKLPWKLYVSNLFQTSVEWECVCPLKMVHTLKYLNWGPKRNLKLETGCSLPFFKLAVFFLVSSAILILAVFFLSVLFYVFSSFKNIPAHAFFRSQVNDRF